MTTITAKEKRIKKLTADRGRVESEIQEINAELKRLDEEDTVKVYGKKFGLRAALEEFGLEHVARAFGMKP